MNRKDREAALAAVDQINGELINRLNGSSDVPLICVTFVEDMIFFSLSLPNSTTDFKLSDAEDDRIYFETTDSYELFYYYIKRKYQEITEQINYWKI